MPVLPAVKQEIEKFKAILAMCKFNNNLDFASKKKKTIACLSVQVYVDQPDSHHLATKPLHNCSSATEAWEVAIAKS